MRVNVYAEEMTDRVELVEKQSEDGTFTGIRFYLYLPVTSASGAQNRGRFLHREDDDDSAAVTFWGKKDAKMAFRKALALLGDTDQAERLAMEKRLLIETIIEEDPSADRSSLFFRSIAELRKMVKGETDVAGALLELGLEDLRDELGQAINQLHGIRGAEMAKRTIEACIRRIEKTLEQMK